jgi:hypothetical protein
MVLKKPGTSAGQRNHNLNGGVVASNTIDNPHMNIPSQQQINMLQQLQNTNGSMDGSRPQSAIKKKSNGISPNSKAVK